jgi:hypothetical protein
MWRSPEIAGGLNDHLRLLRGGHRSDPRHQTIRVSVDWSHKLLTDRERQLFARLSVFSGASTWKPPRRCAPGVPSVLARYSTLLVLRYMYTATGAEPFPSWAVRTTGGDAAAPADNYRTPPLGVVR